MYSMNLSDERMDSYMAAFEEFDEGDGSIKASNLKTVMDVLGFAHSDEEIEELLSKVDIDENNAIDFTQFMALLSDGQSAQCYDDDLIESFQSYDFDHDGFIEAFEIKEALMNNDPRDLLNDEIEEMLLKCEKNEKGLVNYEQFFEMMMAV
mmetsp:Transcript_1188/g.1850  ORF Transcript_1188/g.1850 Transcript_1188/m.1850 type:complete len:151 (-) Transcript_1188:63-515(-)